MSSIRPRHDEFIKKAFENPMVAREFFDSYLPKNIKSLLDFDTLNLQKESFIDQSLKNSFSDILFSVNFGNTKGYLYILLEHQTKPDHFMALRLFKYMINIIDRHQIENPNDKQLPLIYPLIFYSGKRKYNASRNLWDLFTNPTLAKDFWVLDHQLINLHEIPDNQLKEKIWAGTMQFFMKHIMERDLIKKWEEITGILPEFTKVEVGYDYIKILLAYSLTKMEENDTIELKKLLTTTLGSKTGKEIMASVAQKWYKEGEHKGRLEGKLEGVKIGEAKGIKIGEAKGIKKVKIALAKKMLAKVKPIEEIIEFTDLTKEQIEQLK